MKPPVLIVCVFRERYTPLYHAQVKKISSSALSMAKMIGCEEVEMLQSENKNAVGISNEGAGVGAALKIRKRTHVLICSMYTI